VKVSYTFSYRDRFSHEDAIRAREITTNPAVQKDEAEEESSEEEVSPTLCSGKNINGTDCKNRVSTAGEYCMRHAEVAANKVKMKELCCHCLEKNSPIIVEGTDLPEDLVLDCSSCNLKHHPACLGIHMQLIR
jgi:hypothetical protein